MRDTPVLMQQVWRSGQFIGPNRPIARVTIQRPRMAFTGKNFPSPKPPPASTFGVPTTQATLNADFGNYQRYASYLFNSPSGSVRELPNVKSVKWQRGVETDVGTATIEMWNCDPLPVGAVPVDDPFRAGSFSYNYGASTFSGRWGHVKNSWSRWLMPDNILYTFEGYGHDRAVIPEKDPNLVQTGVWRIRDVEMTSDEKVMVLTCEDLGSLLNDQICHPPVVPDDWYPLRFNPVPKPVTVVTQTSSEGNPIPMKLVKTSNRPWNGDGAMFGHYPSHALDGNAGSYWLSVGNESPSRGFAYEYIELKCSNGPSNVGKVSFMTVGSGYTAYLSVSTDGGQSWHGGEVIGWSSESIGRNQGNIPWVQQMFVPDEGWQEFHLNWDNVTNVRVTLGNLQWFPQGTYHYRGAFREINCSSGYQVKTSSHQHEIMPATAQAGEYPGVFSDWTDPVRMVLAWGGFFWKKGAGRRLSDDSLLPVSPPRADPVLGVDGRVWADLMDAGTLGPAGLNDIGNNSLMSVIASVKDVLGFVGFFDETGAFVWRLPNLYSLGNWVGTMSENPRRTQDILVLDESTVVSNLRVRLTSRNVREDYYIGDPAGFNAVHSKGWNPNPTGLQRAGVWMDPGFSSKEESGRMAEMIALRSMFSYRTDSVTIAANPAIQIDDQVRIMERTTSEGYVHYVEGISSSNDMTTGIWTYELTTHWLGEDPNGTWAFKSNDLAPAARRATEAGWKRPLWQLPLGIARGE